VDDAAAVTFAETFYEKILGGESLGNAVRQARTTTYLKHPRANTWGAYQVYGNEAYRMRGRRATNEDASSTSAYFDRKQVLDALDRVRADAAVANASAIAALRRRLQDLEVEVAHSGVANVLGKADIQESLGHTWADLGDFARALEYFDKAVAGDQKKVEMRLFERRANLLARHGWNLVRQANGDTDQIKAGLESIETGIQAAEALCVFRKSRERLSILGAAHKRKALAMTATGRKADALKALQSMAQAYAEAHTVQPNSYAFLNLIQSMLLVGKQADITKEDLDQIGKIAVGSGGQSFWELAHPADAALTLRVYMTFKSGEIEPTEWNEVQDRYVALLRRAGSPVQSASVIDQLDAMERLLPPKPSELSKQLRKLLDAIAI
jgi:tetratricopeptide (TPR) repeat protein